MAVSLKANRKFDVVVYGTTGFTGKLVAEYMSKTYPTGVKWAIAGRSEAKLLNLKKSLNLSDDVGVLVADSTDQPSIDAMAKSTKVVLSTTGPFALKGTPLIDACVRLETDYCDITGESQWVRSVIDGYHDAAEKKQLKIVNCCGFDCIPSDIGVMMMATAMQEKNIEPEEIRYIMKEALGGASGGTIASVMHIFDTASSEAMKQASNPFYLAPRDPSTGEPVQATDASVVSSNQDTYSFLYDKVEECWEMPWMMQAIDTRIVNRSNALSGWKYGRNLIYREVMAASNVFSAVATSLVFPLVGLLLYIPFTRNLIKKIVPQPGEGPSQHMLDNGYFKLALWGKGKSKITGKEEVVKGGLNCFNGDGGYRQTAKFIAESAISLALDGSSLPQTYGVLTPSTAMGDVLLNRLRKQGVDFYVK